MAGKDSRTDKDILVFFLGGHDAEMDTIKSILIENYIKPENINDKNLSWGAKVSDYKKELSQLKENQVPVLIELTPDIPYPENAHVIDHHNELAGKDKKSSIEQIADLLTISLNRWQKLISANDKDFIRGMRALGASQEEINIIRKMERDAQQITEEDIKLGLDSVKYYCKDINNDTIIINSLSDKSSPVLERLYELYEDRIKHIVIINRNGGFFYSGDGGRVLDLRNRYNSLIGNNPDVYMYYGGILPERGYFGSNKSLSEEDILSIIAAPVISEHIFMFPFISKDLMNKLDDFEKRGWKREKHIAENTTEIKQDELGNDIIDHEFALKYCEYNYFYQGVRDSLYGTKDKTNDNEFPRIFIRDNDPISKSEFIITIKKDNKNVVYRLNIEKITLRIFTDKAGILTLFLQNYQYPDLESILYINDFGRRIFPQYLGIHGTNDTKESFLPMKIIFKGSIESEENFGNESYTKIIPRYADYIQKLLDPLRNFQTIIDDRMFTICWYGDNIFSKELIDYENSENWYKFIFLDSSYIGVDNKRMMSDLIKSSTYDRFSNSGTLIGITRYSFVCSTDRSYYPYEILRYHIKGMYYQLVTLLLIQRASLLYLNSEIRDKSKALERELNNINRKNPYLKKIFNEIEKFDAKVNLHINTLHFDEVTAQEQGIEVYSMAKRIMNIDYEESSLKTKVKDIYTVINSIQSGNTGNLVAILTIISAVFVPLTFWAALWAMEPPIMQTFYDKIGNWHYLDATHIQNLLFISMLIWVIWFSSRLIIISNQAELRVENLLSIIYTSLGLGRKSQKRDWNSKIKRISFLIFSILILAGTVGLIIWKIFAGIK
jgi:hypothetical protein